MSETEIVVLTESLKSLKWHQLWPKKGQSLNCYYLNYLLVILICSPVWVMTISHVIIMKDNSDVDLSQDFGMLSSVLGLHFILLSFVWKQRKIAVIYRYLSDFDVFGKPDNFDKTNQHLNLYSKFYSLYCFTGILIYTLVSLINQPNCEKMNKEKNLNELCGLFVPAWLPFNINYFPLKQLLLIIQIFVGMMIIKGGATVSFTTFEVAQHIVLRIKHLNKLLNEIFDDPDENIMRQRLLKCIKYHGYIIEIQALFDHCYKNCNGCYILLTGIIFGCITNQFVKKWDIGALIHLGGWIISLFVDCYAGQSILSESMTISTAAFGSKWYRANIKIQRDLLFLMERSQIPFFLHATPVGTMTLSLFIKLLKTSYSYFTLLNQSL